MSTDASPVRRSILRAADSLPVRIADIERDRAEAIARRDELFEAVTFIELQLTMARRDAAANGRYSDADWFQRATFALVNKQVELKRLNVRIQETDRHLGRLKKELNVAESDRREKERERTFVRAARHLLPQPLYASIWAEVDRMMADAEGESDA